MTKEQHAKVSWTWVLGTWSIPTVLGAFASYANAREAGPAISIGRALWVGTASWLLWALFTPMIVWLGQHWPIDRRKHWRFVIGHLVAATVIGVAAAVVTAMALYDGSTGAFAEHLRSRILIRGPMGSTLYFIILGVSYLAINTRRLQEKELFVERLSHQLTESQLDALRMQLQPHFLFNSLNAIMVLVRDQATARADRALTLLSDVLRTTLRHGTLPRVPLHEELTFTRHYLEIETLRFGDRLQVTYSIPDGIGTVQVPTFVLQPLVENALQHGLLDLPDGGTLHISAGRRGSTLVLSVTDDGVGLSATWQDRTGRGVGISNLRARLNHIYGPAGTLTITSRTDRTGTCATVELPFEDDA